MFYFCILLIEVLHNITLPLKKKSIDWWVIIISVLVTFVLMQYNSIVKEDGDREEEKSSQIHEMASNLFCALSDSYTAQNRT